MPIISGWSAVRVRRKHLVELKRLARAEKRAVSNYLEVLIEREIAKAGRGASAPEAEDE